MVQHFVVTVRLYEGGFGTARYHGVSQGKPEWPPSPARVYQALVAGAARGNKLPERLVTAFEWLESLQPPIIAAPQRTLGQSVSMFVPNNDADSLANPIDVSGIRIAKVVQPSLFSTGQPLLYAWQLTTDASHTVALAEAASDMYQLGRGVDMAWAVAEVIDDNELVARLTGYRGRVHRPEIGTRSDRMLACPLSGSLSSLVQRHQATKLRVDGSGRKARVLFTNAPKPRFNEVSYGSRTTRLLFDLRDTARAGSPLASWPLARAVELVQVLRGAADENAIPRSGAAQRLWSALPDKHGDIASVLIGRNAAEVDKERRVRIVPIPSIGHEHVNRNIRRVMVEVPPNCPVHVDDIAWAFSGLQIEPIEIDEQTGEVLSSVHLVRSDDNSMLKHYGVETSDSSRVWRSVIPIALPAVSARRRIKPTRLREDSKDGQDRVVEHQRAVEAVMHALRHCGVGAAVHQIRVQREPFEAKGSRAELFAPGTRFAKDRLWHVEIMFATPVQGPLVLGDGRYAGLGLMRPVVTDVGVHGFRIVDGLEKSTDPIACARALRRAVMSRVQEAIGKRETLPSFFTGHESDGRPLRRGEHSHLAFVADLTRQRLLVIAPHLLEHSQPRYERKNLRGLEVAAHGLEQLRAGDAGLLRLTASPLDFDEDPLFCAASEWESVTDYQLTRYAKRVLPEQALVFDVQSEVRRLGIPAPEVEVLTLKKGPNGGLSGRVRLKFPIGIRGPLILGKTRHLGGGLFAKAE
jgi:CRISPR-associated protein Csb2